MAFFWEQCVHLMICHGPSQRSALCLGVAPPAMKLLLQIEDRQLGEPSFKSSVCLMVTIFPCFLPSISFSFTSNLCPRVKSSLCHPLVSARFQYQISHVWLCTRYFWRAVESYRFLTTHPELRHRILSLSSPSLHAQEYSPIIKVYSPGFPNYISIGVESVTQECIGPIKLNSTAYMLSQCEVIINVSPLSLRMSPIICSLESRSNNTDH